MTTTQCLARLRALSKQHEEDHLDRGDVAEMVEAFDQLDQALSMGLDLPEDWLPKSPSPGRGS